MLPLEKRFITRLGNAGWVLYWLPRLHTLSKVYTLHAPAYIRETHQLVDRIQADVAKKYTMEKADLERRKELPVSDFNHISMDKYTRGMESLNRNRDEQGTTFLTDNIIKAAKIVEFNLAWDAFDAGLEAYSTGDYSLGDATRFMRTYVTQDNPRQPGKLGSLYHELRSYVKQKRRDWVPREIPYIEEFIRNVQEHYKRLAKIAYWDGVEYHATLNGAELPARETSKQARASKLTDMEISTIMDTLYFKFQYNPELSLAREEYDRLKAVIILNYDAISQLGTMKLPSGIVREYYIRPAISSIKGV